MTSNQNDTAQEEEIKRLQESSNKVLNAFNKSDAVNALPKIALLLPPFVDLQFKSKPTSESTDLEMLIEKDGDVKVEAENHMRLWDSDFDKFKLLLEDLPQVDLNTEINNLKDRYKILSEIETKMNKAEFKAFAKI